MRPLSIGDRITFRTLFGGTASAVITGFWQGHPIVTHHGLPGYVVRLDSIVEPAPLTSP